jgi:hypothetical protein
MPDQESRSGNGGQKSILTVLEAKPGEEATNPDGGDPLIAKLREKIEAVPAQGPTKHKLLRASSVGALGRVVRDYARTDEARAAPPSILQIVGHGMRGRLSVGFSWAQRRQVAETRAYHLLDSNPYAYDTLLWNMLDGEVMGQIQEVWLVGCAVGDDAPGLTADSRAVGGPTLLFDLAQMWPSCTVAAPQSLVALGDFDGDGLYRDREGMLSIKGWHFTAPKPKEAAVARMIFRAAPTKKEPVVIERLVAAPAAALAPSRLRKPLGVRKRPLSALRPQAVAGAAGDGPPVGVVFKDVFFREVKVEPLLSLVELQFSATWGGKRWLAELLGNGRVLRLRASPSAPGEVHHFVATPSEADGIRQKAASILEPLLE